MRIDEDWRNLECRSRAGEEKRKMSEIDARAKAIGIITGGRVQA